MMRLIRQGQLLFLCPQTLERKQVEIDAIRPPYQPELKRMCIYCHHRLRRYMSDESCNDSVYAVSESSMAAVGLLIVAERASRLTIRQGATRSGDMICFQGYGR